MKNLKRSDYITRDQILKLLSDDEVASVSTAETAIRLADGEAFLDLEQLDRGVQRAKGTGPDMGRVLPKKAVHPDTWNKILAALTSLRSATAAAV
jgi:hypothetical protein